MRRSIKDLTLFLTVVALLGLSSCAYYNTFYNAEQYFEEAQRVTRENQSETISREEINLYSKSIEKSKKLLQKYPESKYRDDAQFLIAKGYYFKGDFLIAKRYFDDLALNYGNSPYVEEVPLWVGRCLLKVGDLEMAQHEASRILRERSNRSLQADALLLMGEIAVQQDSLEVAEKYLEQVIERSPDSFTKAQAQFQVGRMRENKGDFEAALEAYKSVSKFKPSESLKVESIIRQTSMLKALKRDDDAIKMIKRMLEDDKFVDIRGQLEVELAKLYLSTNKLIQAESRFMSILEDYSRQEEAAEASYYLGELQLIHNFKYQAAKEAYVGIKTQSMRSPYVNKGAQRIKQVDRYITLQTDYKNLVRQLAGLKPVEIEKATNTRNRSSRSRGRSRTAGNPTSVDKNKNASKEAPQKGADEAAVSVTPDDSLRFLGQMDENRYALAEYMLFEFARVDTSVLLLDSLELASRDSSMKQQSAYMRYYAIGTIAKDSLGGAAALEHIKKAYPKYYKSITQGGAEKEVKVDPHTDTYLAISDLFEKGDLTQANLAYKNLLEDSTASTTIRAKACFNGAWLNDHYLYDRDAALEGYQYLVSNFSNDPLVETAQKRIKALNIKIKVPTPQEENRGEEDIPQGSQEGSETEKPQQKGPKDGEKQSRRG